MHHKTLLTFLIALQLTLGITPSWATTAARIEADALIASACVAGWFEGPLKPGAGVLVSDAAHQIYLGNQNSETGEIRLSHTVSAIEIAAGHSQYKKFSRDYSRMSSEIIYYKNLRKPIGIAIRKLTKKWDSVLSRTCRNATQSTARGANQSGVSIEEFSFKILSLFTQLLPPDPRSNYFEYWELTSP